MDVVFLHVGEPTHVWKMLASVRDVLPRARIVQMTDETTPALDADEVIRKPYDGYLMTFRLDHLADFPHERALILDTDVLVKRDPSHVFDEPFDVALTRRDNCVSYEGLPIAKAFPYNTGVMFSRSQAFWRYCADWLKYQQQDAWKWWGDQWAVVYAATHGGFNVRDLSCDEYNWSPRDASDTSDAYVWHYKGKRKEWM